MNDFSLSFLNGRLLCIDSSKKFIGYEPIFSESMNYPGDKSWEIERAEHDVLLDGEAFNIRIKHRRRGSWGGFGLLGLEVFSDGRHMTTYLDFNSLATNKKYGSKWFYHNDCCYLLSSGLNFYQGENATPVSLDKQPMEEKYQYIEKDKLYLVKFKTFTGCHASFANKTIEEILTSLLIEEKSWTYPLLKTLEAWDLKPFWQ